VRASSNLTQWRQDAKNRLENFAPWRLCVIRCLASAMPSWAFLNLAMAADTFLIGKTKVIAQFRLRPSEITFSS